MNPDHTILIKVDVYDAAYRKLRDAGVAVIDQRIPFPSTGQQTNFARLFKTALCTAGFGRRAPADGRA